MKQKGYSSLDGYMTIVSIFIFSILLSLVIVLITGVQKSTMQVEAELALDTACHSALAEYHQELLSQYDLFFIDVAYGKEQPDVAELENHIRYYANKNLGDTNFWDIVTTDVSVEYAQMALDESGEILEMQMLEYMENKLGLDMLDGLKETYSFVLSGNEDQEQLLKVRDENQNKLDREPTPVKVTYKEEYDAETGETKQVEIREEVPIVNPAENVNQNRNKGILALVTKNPSEISSVATDLNQYYSKRGRIIEGSGHLTDEARTEENAIVDELLKVLYIQEKCGCYVNQKEGSFMKYQQEYILCGKDNDMDNLKETVHKIVALREAVNAAYLYSDSVKRAEISALAASVAAVAVAPHIQPMLETSILFAWAYMESLYDVRILLDGGKVPMIKTRENWNTDLSVILNSQNVETGKSSERGLSYEDYLKIFLYIEDKKQRINRMTDIIEMDIRQKTYNENFKIDGCLSAFLVNGFFISNHGHICDITRLYTY